jgi:hypothetical protein
MLELFAFEHRGLVQDYLAFAVCAAALLWGAAPERAVAATWLIVFELAGRIYRALFADGFMLLDIDPFLAGADVVAGAAWIVIALYANRNYPLWIAGLQLLTITAHLARAIADVISPVAYATLVIAPGWLQLLILAAGVARHAYRRQQYGNYRSWRTAPDGADLPLVAGLDEFFGNWRGSKKNG